ncbi:unnamed protein product [Acanthoscelides obtectus]|uniref:SCAN domain-containing protein 3 n=1 Tax=Acanthoscelides obtectus TaxID=200917 RepID=A0A9P0L2M9_ACAOB|nr:unnamed protein product [Acanthoscelides obtectus]CAK1659981.1 SCAN domain-containing protein 3 [Acanthoscelides obtectus]
MKQNLGRGEFSQFPNLSQTSCQEDDVSTYVQHLNVLYSDFESRFEDILTMVIPPWIINLYGDIEERNVIIQEELTELSTNEELKVQFKNGYQQFWLQNNIPVTYPVLWNIARKFSISFPSSYLVERGFSAVTNLLTKKRNRLDIISRPERGSVSFQCAPRHSTLLILVPVSGKIYPKQQPKTTLCSLLKETTDVEDLRLQGSSNERKQRRGNNILQRHTMTSSPIHSNPYLTNHFPLRAYAAKLERLLGAFAYRINIHPGGLYHFEYVFQKNRTSSFKQQASVL